MPAVAVGPHVAHPARQFVVRAPHHVIHDQAVLAGSEKFRETHVPKLLGRFVAKIGRAFAEYVIGFDDRAGRQLSAKSSDALGLVL